VCTIDGQGISSAHFRKPLPQNTILASDLLANPAIPRRFLASGNPVLWTAGAHPLVSLFRAYLGEQGLDPDSVLPQVSAASGTVTLYALDFAVRGGYNDITLAGADFSFFGGKPYAQGTYLDDFFHGSSCRTQSAEGAFTALMYRGKTIAVSAPPGFPKSRTILSAPLLDAYYRAAVESIASYGALKTVDIASISARPIARRAIRAGRPPRPSVFTIQPVSDRGGAAGDYAASFVDWYLRALTENREKSRGDHIDERIMLSLLPLGAWLCKKTIKKYEKIDVFSLLELAHKLITRYTEGQNGSENG
jgi:hypothetical protein